MKYEFTRFNKTSGDMTSNHQYCNQNEKVEYLSLNLSLFTKWCARYKNNFKIPNIV